MKIMIENWAANNERLRNAGLRFKEDKMGMMSQSKNTVAVKIRSY